MGKWREARHLLHSGTEQPWMRSSPRPRPTQCVPDLLSHLRGALHMIVPFLEQLQNWSDHVLYYPDTSDVTDIPIRAELTIPLIKCQMVK